MEKRSVVIDDQFETKSVTNPVLAPNDQEAVFTVTQVHKEDNTYYSAIHHIDLETERITQWTFGEQKVSDLKWSSDGDYIAFLSNRRETDQLYIMQKADGQARALTDYKEGIDSFDWSPCGKNIWFTSEMTEVDCHRRIGYVDTATGEIFDYMDESFNYSLEAVSHDGKQLVAASINQQSLVIVDLETKEQTVIVEGQGHFSHVAFSKNDQYIAYIGYDTTYHNVPQADVFIYDQTDQLTMNLTAGMDAPIGDESISDHVHRSARGVVWTVDEQLYFQLSAMGDVRLYAATLDGAMYPATGEEEHVNGYDVASNAEFALITVSTMTNPGELYRQTIATGERTQLTSFNEEWLKQVELVEPQTIHYTSGTEAIQGWLMKPANYTQGEQYPLVVKIHDKPHAMYGYTYYHDMQVLAAQYGVLYINPRGSHGYSQAFVDAGLEAYDETAYVDSMAGVDEVLKTETWIDKSHIILNDFLN